MHLLPLNLEKLAGHCADATAHRYALQGVELRLAGDGTYVACASDGRSLVRVTGPVAGEASEYPSLPALASAQNGATEAIIPAAGWQKAFGAARKLTRRLKGKPAALRSVAVVAGREQTTLASTDGESSVVETARNVEGRFPDTGAVIPNPGSGRDRVWVDPLRLADVLKTAAEFTAEGGTGPVVLETNGGHPLTVSTPNGPQHFVAVVMPMSHPDGHPLAPGNAGPDGAETANELDTLRRTVAGLRNEITELRRDNRTLYAGRADAEGLVRTLQANVAGLQSALAVARSVATV